MKNILTANMDRHIGLPLLLTLALTFFACSSDNDDNNNNNGDPSSSSGGGSGNIESVTIGTQVWMKKNLNVDVEGSKCYDNLPANCTTYGKLYTWDMAKDACPNGWKLPSDTDWETLISFAGGDIAGKNLKATSNDWNNNGKGLDIHEFTALPSGRGRSNYDDFSNFGDNGYWWSNTSDDATHHNYLRMDYDSDETFTSSTNEPRMFSVRCIKD